MHYFFSEQHSRMDLVWTSCIHTHSFLSACVIHFSKRRKSESVIASQQTFCWRVITFQFWFEWHTVGGALTVAESASKKFWQGSSLKYVKPPFSSFFFLYSIGEISFICLFQRAEGDTFQRKGKANSSQIQVCSSEDFPSCSCDNPNIFGLFL